MIMIQNNDGTTTNIDNMIKQESQESVDLQIASSSQQDIGEVRPKKKA